MPSASTASDAVITASYRAGFGGCGERGGCYDARPDPRFLLLALNKSDTKNPRIEVILLSRNSAGLPSAWMDGAGTTKEIKKWGSTVLMHDAKFIGEAKMMKHTEQAIINMMASIQPDPFGMIALNGGFELTIRGLMLFYLRQQFHGSIVVAEYTLPKLKNKRADIALLDNTIANQCNGLIELKGNFVSQAGSIPGRFQSDFNKWHPNIPLNPSVPSVLFLYFFLKWIQC